MVLAGYQKRHSAKQTQFQWVSVASWSLRDPSNRFSWTQNVQVGQDLLGGDFVSSIHKYKHQIVDASVPLLALSYLSRHPSHSCTLPSTNRRCLKRQSRIA